MLIKELTDDVLDRAASRVRNPQTVAVLRSGCLERYTDTDGTVYMRRDILARDGGMITKAAPRPTPTPEVERGLGTGLDLGKHLEPANPLADFFRALAPDPEVERRASRVAQVTAHEAAQRENDKRLAPVFEEMDRLGGAQ